MDTNFTILYLKAKKAEGAGDELAEALEKTRALKIKDDEAKICQKEAAKEVSHLYSKSS